MATILNYDLDVNVFELLSFYYVYFWTNTLGEGIKLFISPHPVMVK